jgi:hypothetical protein
MGSQHRLFDGQLGQLDDVYARFTGGGHDQSVTPVAAQVDDDDRAFKATQASDPATALWWV